MIGKDFEPINFILFGMDLTDPTDFIYDLILGIMSLIFAYRAFQLKYKGDFVTSWQKFFLFFGLSTLLSAFGHLFYNYFHVYGKLPGWLLIPIAMYWIERAVINAHLNKAIISKANKIYLAQLIALYLVFIVSWFLIDIDIHPKKIFIPIAINTIVGLLLGVGLFSYLFKSKISASFRHIFYGILIIFPSAFVFLLKINPHPWFSKNDISHILMIFGVAFFYYGFNQILKEKHAFIIAK